NAVLRCYSFASSSVWINTRSQRYAAAAICLQSAIDTKMVAPESSCSNNRDMQRRCAHLLCRSLNRLAALAVQLKQLCYLVFTLARGRTGKARSAATAGLDHIGGGSDEFQQVQCNIFCAACGNRSVHKVLIVIVNE